MDDFMDDEIGRVVKRDVINEIHKKAEVLGVNDEEAITKASFQAHLIHKEDKETLLEMTGDSILHSKLENYFEILEVEGFKKVLEIPFHCEKGDDTLYIFWHPEKFILLKFDTYQGKSINGGDFYYNWVPNDNQVGWECVSSGCYREASEGFEITEDGVTKHIVWCGSHDAREAIRYHIRQLTNNGTFVKWVDRPYLWLVHYAEETGKVDKINQQRINLLPKDVKKIINNAKDSWAEGRKERKKRRYYNFMLGMCEWWKLILPKKYHENKWAIITVNAVVILMFLGLIIINVLQ